MIDDPQQLASAVGAWLAHRHPDRTPLEVRGLQRSAGGFSNVTVMGELQWTVRGTSQVVPIVIRVQPDEPSVYPDCYVSRQYRIMEALAGTSVPVPEVLGFETDARWLGAPFFLMRRVAGRVPQENPLYHLEGWFHELSPDALRRHWFAGVDTIAAVARVDWRALALEWLRPPAGITPLARQLAYYQDALRWAEELGRPYPHLHGAYDWLVRQQPRDEPVALSWADAKLGNCVFDDEGRIAAALDWEQATLASPVDDLAWWLMLDESLCTGYGLPRLAGLPSREETVTRWERATGLSARHLPYYDVFAAWRMAYVMARIGTIFMQRGYAARESEMDVRNGGATLLALHAARLGFG